MLKLTRRKLYAQVPEGGQRNSVVAYSKYPIKFGPIGLGFSKRITIDFLFFDLKIQWRAK